MDNPFKKYGAFGYNWWYLIRHPWEIPIGCWYDIKAFCQRGWRGYADRDVWSLDGYLNSWMPKAIRELKSGNGTPGGLFEELYGVTYDDEHPWSNERPTKEEADKTWDYWQDILEQIAIGFESAFILEDEIPPHNSERRNDLEAKKKKGLELFIKHYDALWD